MALGDFNLPGLPSLQPGVRTTLTGILQGAFGGKPSTPTTVLFGKGGLFRGGESNRGLSGGGLSPADSLSGIISLSGPFTSTSFRGAAASSVPDSNEINRVGNDIIKQLNFLGLNNEATQLNTILRKMFGATGIEDQNALNSQALTAVGSVKNFINTQLGQPDFTFKGLSGADILDEFNRLDTISFSKTKLPKLKNLVTQFQQQIRLANENLNNPDLDKAFQLNELSIVGERLKKEEAEFNSLTRRLNTAQSGLRGFLDPGFEVPQPGDPDFVGPLQPEQPEPPVTKEGGIISRLLDELNPLEPGDIEGLETGIFDKALAELKEGKLPNLTPLLTALPSLLKLSLPQDGSDTSQQVQSSTQGLLNNLFGASLTQSQAQPQQSGLIPPVPIGLRRQIAEQDTPIKKGMFEQEGFPVRGRGILSRFA